MGKLILIQHCQSEHHVNGMTGGWTDTPLTSLGIQQAERIAARLHNELSDISSFTLISSDLLRASQTAGIIAEKLQLPVQYNQALREINTGIAIGKTREWANANRNPRKNNNFDFDYLEFNEGETWRQFYDRVCTYMDQLVGNNLQQNWLIVTHGGTLSYIIAWWLKFNEQMLANAYFTARPASISILSENKYGQHVLERLNDTAHL